MNCPACGAENPMGMRFCGHCGASLTPAPSAQEERKLVTVLFADAVASTYQAGAVDPERLRGQMARFFEVAREEIERYGGTVEKFIGDAVMAVFGLPAIHEDDPERAVRAAAAIRARTRPEVAAGHLPDIRIGLFTGEVVANPQATEKGEFLVTGEAVNLAARLQQHAGPGQILVGERTGRGLRDMATLRPVAPLTVKGHDDPLPVWELLEVAAPRERRLLATPFIGREEELRLLDGYARRTRREGRGHVVTVLGPAGVGKTRLVREFQTRTEGLRILRGRALPYGTGVPFWSIGEAIREEYGIVFGDPLEVARRKVEDAARNLEVSDALPALRTVLGLGGDGTELTREAMFGGLRAFFQALARRAPLLLILEDIHSAEDVTLDYLEHAADWIREVPLLLLILSRSELLDRRPGWMGGKRSASTLYLDPLGGDESRELALAILGGKEAPEAVLDLVLERAEGNPLFMEEMLRALTERGVLLDAGDRWTLSVPLAQVIIPDTVYAVIAARVDALPGPEKQVLQAAALQGKDFYLGGVRFVAEENHVDEALGTLVGRELLIRKPRSTLAGEEEFTFRHILIRDVAYATIPKSQRWSKHARLAKWLHDTAGDRPAEWADLIAHHWLQVVGLRRELGLAPDAYAREQAIANLLLAGDRAAGVYANTTAIDHYSRALDLAPETSARLRALLGRGEVWMLLGQFDRAREDFAAVRALARGANDLRWEAVALDRLGHAFRQQDQIGHALAHLGAALPLSREVADPALTGRILNHIGFTYFADGKLAESIRAHQEAQSLLEATQGTADLAESLHGLGDSLMFQGRLQEGIHSYLASVKICDQIGNRSLAGENRFMIAFARQKLGRYDEAQVDAQRSVDTLAEIGDVRQLSPALFVAADIDVTLGRFGKALEYANRGLSLARQIEVVRIAVYHLFAIGKIHREIEDIHGSWQTDREAADLAGRVGGSAWLPAVLASLALDEAALGRTGDAQAHIREARRVLDETEVRLDFLQEVTHAEGQMLLAIGRAGGARDAANNLLERVTVTGTLHWRVPAMLLGADAMAALGDPEAAALTYAAAADEAQRRGRLPALWRALAGLADVQRAVSRLDEAAASARRAREIIDRLAATVPDERLRATFLQSPAVQRVVSRAGT